MKNIILGILCFVSLISWVFANSQIDLQVSERNLEVGQRFILSVELKDIVIEWSSGEISIPWIENFEIFSQNTSTRAQNINGVTQSITQFQLALSPKYVWNYEIWPVSIGDDESLKDNEKIVVIVSNSVQSSPTQSSVNQKSWGTGTVDTQAVLENMSQWKLWKLREVPFPLLGHIFILIFFIGAFYFLLRYILNSDKKPVQKIQVPQTAENQNETYKKYFEKLSQKIWKIPSEIFFQQFNIGIRKIFLDIGLDKAQTLTLNEIMKQKKDISPEILQLFVKSYKHEYSKANISAVTQKKYIENILSAL